MGAVIVSNVAHVQSAFSPVNDGIGCSVFSVVALPIDAPPVEVNDASYFSKVMKHRVVITRKYTLKPNVDQSPSIMLGIL